MIVLDPNILTGFHNGRFVASAVDKRVYLLTGDGAIPAVGDRVAQDIETVNIGSDWFKKANDGMRIITPSSPVTVGINSFDGGVNGMFSSAARRCYVNAGSRFAEFFRNNLLLRSQELDNAVWTKTRSTLAVNASNAPDGTTSADKIIPNSANDTHLVSQAATVIADQAVTLSCYIKASGYNYAMIRSGNTGGTIAFQAVFNLLTGEIVSNTAYGAGAVTTGAKITNAGNGWYRASVTGSIAALTAYRAFIFVHNNSNSATFVGDGVSGILAWGAQLNNGDLVDYSKTEGAALQ